MGIISSHVLDSVIGTHASGIRVECHRRLPGGSWALVFDTQATEDGRIAESVGTAEDQADTEYELIFHSKAYYERMSLPDDGYQIVNTVVVRVVLPEPADKYHIPIMLSPHSYSVWWSGQPQLQATPHA